MRGAERPPKKSEPPRMPPRRTWLTFLLILLVNFVLMRFLLPSGDAPVTVPYTAFKQEVAKGNVEAIYSKGESIEGRFAAPVTWPPARDGGGEGAGTRACGLAAAPAPARLRRLAPRRPSPPRCPPSWTRRSRPS